MKPAEQTPLDRAADGGAGRRSGFRRACSTSSTASAKRPGAALCTHPDVDKIAFTGHVDTAKIIQKATADTLKRTSYELGGKSPNVIFADANIDDAVGRGVPRHLLPRRPVLHGRQPAVRRGQDPRGVRRQAGREGQRARIGDPLDSDDPAGARRSRRSSSTRSWATSTSARSRGPSSSPAARRRASRASSSSRRSSMA